MSEVNIYSKEQSDAKFDEKANVDDVYTKTETETLVNNKQDVLESGVNIKTVNGESLLGSGDLEITSAQIKYVTFSGSPESSTFHDMDIVIVNAMSSNSVVRNGLYAYSNIDTSLHSIGVAQVGEAVTLNDVVNVSTITLFAGWIIRS